MEPLSLGRLWPDTLETVRRHAELVVPVAGAFLFLPQLLFNWQTADTPPADLFRAGRFLGDSAAFAFLVLMSLVGQLVLASLAVFEGTAGRTLGHLIGRSAALIPAALAVSLIQGIGVFGGLILFVIPGLWILSRLSVVIPVLVDREQDPLAAVRRAWLMTKGRALPIFGMLAVLIAGLLLLSLAISALGAAIGVITSVASGAEPAARGWGLARWLFEAVAAAASTTFGVLWIMFIARLYTVLSGDRALTA